MTIFRRTLLISVLALSTAMPALAQTASQTLVVAGPRTPESLDLDYPSTEAVNEARKNIYERLLGYEMVPNKDGILVENFDKVVGALAEKWEVSPDRKTITFHLRKATSHAGNQLTADDVMWTFKRGWELKGVFYWYVNQMLKITDFDAAFKKVDDMTVSVSAPEASPLIERLWVNPELGMIDATEVKKHISEQDPWGKKWLSTNTASYSPYRIATYTPGQEVVYEANDAYYRGAPVIKKVIFREIPTSSNRVAALQAGSIDVAESLLPREIYLLDKVPSVKVWKVFGNIIHRIDMNNTTKPFTDPKVRQALNYLVPRDQLLKAVYFGNARLTKSPVSEIYPGYTDQFFVYDEDVAKAKSLLKEAGYADGFTVELGYRTGDEIEEQIAVVLKTAFARAGVTLNLTKLPSSNLVDRYTKGSIPMWFLRDSAFVPDATYVTNLWLNSASFPDFSKYKNAEVDSLINKNLAAIDEPARLKDMKRVQEIVLSEAPWIFLFNPGYQLATRATVQGFSWNTANSNEWYYFKKN